MILVSLKDDFGRLDRALMVLEREHMPFAIARALTDMAQLGKRTITAEIPRIFAKGGPPKPFTVNSVVAKGANKSTLSAEVFIKDKQAAYLQLEEIGGARSPHGSALVLPGSEAADLHDVHGNLPEGLLRRLRAAVRTTRGNAKRAARAKVRAERGNARAGGAAPVAVPTAPQRDTGIVFFQGAGPHGRGTGGYYERLAGDHLRRLAGFEGSAEYRPIFHYHETLRRVIGAAWPAALMRRLREAIG